MYTCQHSRKLWETPTFFIVVNERVSNKQSHGHFDVSIMLVRSEIDRNIHSLINNAGYCYASVKMLIGMDLQIQVLREKCKQYESTGLIACKALKCSHFI